MDITLVPLTYDADIISGKKKGSDLTFSAPV